MEHHLSTFRPYERDAKHEDQLTRAAGMERIRCRRNTGVTRTHDGPARVGHSLDRRAPQLLDIGNPTLADMGAIIARKPPPFTVPPN